MSPARRNRSLALLALLMLAGSLPALLADVWPGTRAWLPIWTITVAPALAAIAGLTLLVLVYRLRWQGNG